MFSGGQTNLYVYVGNNPVNWNDPDGLCPAVAPALPWILGGLRALGPPIARMAVAAGARWT